MLHFCHILSQTQIIIKYKTKMTMFRKMMIFSQNQREILNGELTQLNRKQYILQSNKILI